MVPIPMPSSRSWLTRRSFLRSALAGGATAALAGTGWARMRRRGSSDARRVIVAGAGLAGLTAALDLRDAGWDVVVLEARSRVGGRVHTLYEPFSDGLHAEAGGESIDDNHDRLLAMLSRFGLQTELRPPNKLLDAVVYYRGERAPILDFLGRRSGTVLQDYLRFGEALAGLGVGIDPEHPDQAANAAALDRRSLDDFIREQRLSPEAEFIVRLENRGGYNAEAREVSLLFAAQQSAVVADVPDDAAETMRISGGNSRLVEAMAAELGDVVQLNAPITAVEYDGAGIRVHTGNRTIAGAQLVLALPMPPLRRIKFSPALPAPLAAMIRRFDLGSAAKVVHQYTSRFWEPSGASGFTLTDLPFAVGWSPTDSYASTGGLLSQFITGRAARVAARLPDARRIRIFGRQLDRVYPEARDLHAPHTATMAWANEPYTGGGYAIYRPGQFIPFWPLLREGLPRIHFAGEHTETLAGYMESAVRSGHRIAQQLGNAG